MNAVTSPRIARSVCPHDCPSTCALDVEVIDAHTIGRVRGAKDDPVHRRRDLREGRPLRRAHPPSRPPAPSAAPRRPEGRRRVAADQLGRGLRRNRRQVARHRGRARARGDLALFLCRHHGARAPRRHRPPAPRPRLLAAVRDHLHRHRLARLRRRRRGDFRPEPRADGRERLRGDLGHQRGRDAGQRDDPRRPRPQDPRGQARRHRHLPQRHHGTGRHAAGAAPRDRRGAGGGGDAHPPARRPRRPRLHGPLHRLLARVRGAPQDPHARNGPPASPG